MISSLRNSKKLITFSLWFIIAAFVGTIFFVWGVGTKTQDALYAVKVNGTVITDTEFRDKVDTTRNQFRQLFGNNLDEALKGNTLEKTVMESLIDEELLREEAAKLNVPVSDAEIAAQIQSTQAFQTDGHFDQQLYVQLLGRNRLTPQIYEAALKRDLTVKKMQDIVKQSVAVSDAEISNEYVYQNTEASVRYLELKAENFVSQVKYSDDDLKKFYDENKENFRVPEKADFKYVVFDPEAYKGSFQATDEEIERFFINNKESFKEPEKVNAAHILFKVDNWSDEAAANKIYQKAKEVREQIVKGADFAKMAKKYSQDGTAANGGELGWFTKDQMVPEFEKAAFETKPGEISDVVKTQFGFHIIKVHDYKAESNPTLDEVKAKIAQTIKDQKSQASFRSYVFDTYKAILDKSNITAYNEQAEQKLTVNEIKGLSAAADQPPLKGQTKIVEKLLKMDKSEMSQVIDVNGLKMIFEMTEKYDSYIPELKDISSDALNEYIRKTTVEMAQQKAKEAAALNNMDAAGEALKEVYSTTPKFKRNEPIAGIGLNKRLMDAIFKAQPGSFLQDAYTVGSKVYVVQVKEIIKPDPAKMDDSEKDQIKSSLLGVKSEEALKEYLANLKKNAKIEVHPRYAEYYN